MKKVGLFSYPISEELIICYFKCKKELKKVEIIISQSRELLLPRKYINYTKKDGTICLKGYRLVRKHEAMHKEINDIINHYVRRRDFLIGYIDNIDSIIILMDKEALSP